MVAAVAEVDELRCGVVGLGRGRQFVSIFERLPQCEVIAVCNPSGRGFDELDRYACHTSYEAFLDEQLDAVAILSPGPAHASQSIAALERGYHVLCETPCIYSVDEARAVVAAAAASPATYMLAENYLWMGWYLALAERADLIGDVLYAEGDYTHDCRDYMLAEQGVFVPYRDRAAHPNAAKTWRATDLPPLAYSSHTLGPLLAFMGDRITSCYGLGVGGRTAPELGTVDLEAGLFTTEKQAVIRLTNGFTVAHPMAFHYKIVGTRGCFALQHYGEVTSFFYSDGKAGAAGALGDATDDTGTAGWQRLEIPFGERPDGRDSTAAMVADWAAALAAGEQPPLGVEESIAMVLPGVLAHQSAERGGEVLAVPNLHASN